MNAAMASSRVKRLVVCTDDPEIEKIAFSFKAEILTRPDHLNTATALGEDVFAYAFQKLKPDYRDAEKAIFVLLMANAPTISTDLIEEGIRRLDEDTSADSAVSVSRYNMWSPSRARQISAGGTLIPFAPTSLYNVETQVNCDRDSQGDVWFADMGVSIVRGRALANIQSGQPPQRWMGRKILPIFNDAGLDVDYEFQLPQAEWWLKHNNQSP
jgi:CMP-2-keto-3-deoxyoctulosonic acid synthetase